MIFVLVYLVSLVLLIIATAMSAPTGKIDGSFVLISFTPVVNTVIVLALLYHVIRVSVFGR
jgi:hypothetical protein